MPIEKTQIFKIYFISNDSTKRLSKIRSWPWDRLWFGSGANPVLNSLYDGFENEDFPTSFRKLLRKSWAVLVIDLQNFYCHCSAPNYTSALSRWCTLPGVSRMKLETLLLTWKSFKIDLKWNPMPKTWFQFFFLTKYFHFCLLSKAVQNCQLRGLPLEVFRKKPNISKKSQIY